MFRLPLGNRSSTTPKGWKDCSRLGNHSSVTPKGWKDCRLGNRSSVTPKGWKDCRSGNRSSVTPKGWKDCRLGNRSSTTPKGWKDCRLGNRSSVTPKGWHGSRESCHPFGIFVARRSVVTILSSLRDWVGIHLSSLISHLSSFFFCLPHSVPASPPPPFPAPRR